jgi:hypothetical protein
MTSFHWRTFLALLSGIFLAAIIILPFTTTRAGQSSATFKLKGKANNPDAFYLYATGGTISYGFIYDPHAADDWMFRTAEGSMGQFRQSQSNFKNNPDGR